MIDCSGTMAHQPITNIDDPRYVKAISHPLRVRILAMLQERTASPSQLSEWLGATLGTTAYHVRALHKLGLIELADETRVRGAIEHHYRAGVRPLVTEDAWAQAPPIAKQAAIGSSLQMIDEYARKSAAEGGFDRAEAVLSRTTVEIDEKGWDALTKASMKFIEQVEKIEKASKERQEKRPHDEPVGNAAVVLMAFEAARLSGQQPEHNRKRSARRPPKRHTSTT
jgi:DNA-binding transcriptional ArsR family regulator